MTVSPNGPNAPADPSGDLRPLVAGGLTGIPIWLIAGVAVLGAVLLFGVLEQQRRARIAPTTRVRTIDQVPMPAALPPLQIDTEPRYENLQVPPPPAPPVSLPPPPPRGGVPSFPTQSAPFPAYPIQPPYAPPSTGPAFLPEPGGRERPRPQSPGDVLVIDTTRTAGAPAESARPGGTAPSGDAPASATAASRSATPTRATRLGRGSTIVPQGTLIPAVLETALDSTRPGQVRALVSRDVTGFDGSQVLIPRGSRLFGEYEADLEDGQNRAFVQWTRLVRPDGVAIAIESPAADRLGRAGVQGRVDSHFLQRFGAAVLQSTVNLGLGLAGRNIGGNSSVIVALPGSNQAAVSATSAQIRPTLRVDAGVSVTVFVARDLEFPGVGARPR